SSRHKGITKKIKNMNSHIKNARMLTDLLENKFSLFGFKFGLDPIIGFIPFFGDALTFLLSAYIIWIAHNSDVPGHAITKMWRNIIFDFFIGSVPVIGDISDFFYKASTKNLKILEQY